jgi:ribulose-5-phosphate 4-epimerase/fuculose-1-phosphate aldolase
MQGWIEDFKQGVLHLKKIAPSRGWREFFWGILCEKSRFYANKSYFFQF